MFFTHYEASLGSYISLGGKSRGPLGAEYIHRPGHSLVILVYHWILGEEHFLSSRAEIALIIVMIVRSVMWRLHGVKDNKFLSI